MVPRSFRVTVRFRRSTDAPVLAATVGVCVRCARTGKCERIQRSRPRASTVPQAS